MPTCNECGSHWFNPAIHQCPVCGTLTVEGLAGALSDAMRKVPALLENLPPLDGKLHSADPVVRKAILDVLTKAQTRPAFDLLLSAARKARAEDKRYDILCALYYYPQYSADLVPFLLGVAAESDDESQCRGVAIVGIGNVGNSAIEYLIEHQHGIRDQKLFWEALMSAAGKIDDADHITQFITRELQAGRVAAQDLDALLRTREKPWFPTDQVVVYAVGLLKSQSQSADRNAAANVLFHCSSVSEQAKKHLASLTHDAVLGIRCRAVQVCCKDSADIKIMSVLCAAANLESIVERGAGERMETKEQLLREIEHTVRQTFANPGECLEWVRKNWFADESDNTTE